MKVRSVATTFKRAAIDVRRARVRAWLAATTPRASRGCDGATVRRRWRALAMRDARRASLPPPWPAKVLRVRARMGAPPSRLHDRERPLRTHRPDPLARRPRQP